MEQAPLPLPRVAGQGSKRYRPLKPHKCPFCAQPIKAKRYALMAWHNFREWLVEHWDWAQDRLFYRVTEAGTVLQINPDLLFALESEAALRGLELDDCANEIIDSFFNGGFEYIHRRARHDLRRASKSGKKPKPKRGPYKKGEASPESCSGPDSNLTPLETLIASDYGAEA